MHKPGMSRVGLGRCLMLTKVHLGVLLTSLSHIAYIYVFVHLILQSRDKFNSWLFLWGFSLEGEVWYSSLCFICWQWDPRDLPHQLDSFTCCLEWKDLPKACRKANVCFGWGLFCEMSQWMEWGLNWTIASRNMWESSSLRCGQDPRHSGKGSPAYRAGGVVDEESSLVFGPSEPQTPTLQSLAPSFLCS